MAANPRLVNKNITVVWDGGSFGVTRGTVVDIPAGSSLETAYGAGNLSAIGTADTTEPLGTGTG